MRASRGCELAFCRPFLSPILFPSPQAKTPPFKLSIPSPPSGSFHPTGLIVTVSHYHALNSTSPSSLLLMIVNHPFAKSSGVVDLFVHVLNSDKGRSNPILEHHSRLGADKLRVEGKIHSPHKISIFEEQYSPPLPMGYRFDGNDGVDALDDISADTDQGEKSIGVKTVQIPSFFFSSLAPPISKSHPRTFESSLLSHFFSHFGFTSRKVASSVINVYLARSETTRNLFAGDPVWSGFSPIPRAWNGGGPAFGSNSSASNLLVLTTGVGHSGVIDWEQHWVRGIGNNIEMHDEPYHFVHKEDVAKGYEVSQVKSYTPEFYTHNEVKFSTPMRGLDLDDWGRIWAVGSENSHELDDWIEFLREKHEDHLLDVNAPKSKEKKKVTLNTNHHSIKRPSSIVTQVTYLLRSGPSMAHPWESRRLKSVKERGIFLKKEWINLPIFSRAHEDVEFKSVEGGSELQEIPFKALKLKEDGAKLGFLPSAPTGIAMDRERGLVIVTGAWEDRGVALCKIPIGWAEV